MSSNLLEEKDHGAVYRVGIQPVMNGILKTSLVALSLLFVEIGSLFRRQLRNISRRHRKNKGEK